MTKPTNLISLDQRRRAQRALHFFADLLGGGSIQPVGGLSPPLPDVHHLPRLKMDIAVTRDPAPNHSREILAFARRRQVGFILARFRDPAPDVAEALIDVFWVEGRGVAILEGLSAVKPDGRHWTLVGPHEGDLNLRVLNGGLVPTLSLPWPRGGDRDAFVARGDRIFSDYLWHE
jgi:hypothetical protein